MEKIEGLRFQYLARVLIALATALPDRDTIPGRDRIIRILFRATVVLFKELCLDLMRYEKASS